MSSTGMSSAGIDSGGTSGAGMNSAGMDGRADADDVRDRLRDAPADTEQLRAGLARRAEAEGLVDVAYRVVGSPIGELLLAATPRGLVYTGFEVEDREQILAMLADRLGPRVVRAVAALDPVSTSASASASASDTTGSDTAGTATSVAPDPSAVLDRTAAQLGEYLDGDRRDFDLPLDTSLATGFRGEVQRNLVTVGYGRTATYKELAARLDRPGAVRAVGTACASNPLPLVWPCHRVLRTDGGLGGYRGGLETKKRLLAMEAAA